MKVSLKFSFTLYCTGNTGYQNSSELRLGTPLGELRLPYDCWDFGSCWEGLSVTSVTLEIPSGRLEGWVDIAEKAGDSMVLSCVGVWDGKQAGLVGGMSGYGDFDFSDPCVQEGTYKIRHADSWDFPLARYNRRVARHRAVNGYELAHHEAREVAEVFAKEKKGEELSSRELAAVRDWSQKMFWLDEATDEQIFEALERQKLSTAAVSSKEVISPHYQAQFVERFAAGGPVDRLFAEKVWLPSPQSVGGDPEEARWAIRWGSQEARWASPEEFEFLEKASVEGGPRAQQLGREHFFYDHREQRRSQAANDDYEGYGAEEDYEYD